MKTAFDAFFKVALLAVLAWCGNGIWKIATIDPSFPDTMDMRISNPSIPVVWGEEGAIPIRGLMSVSVPQGLKVEITEATLGEIELGPDTQKTLLLMAPTP